MIDLHRKTPKLDGNKFNLNHYFQLKGRMVLEMFEFFDILWEQWNTFEKFNVDQYMSSMGLSVARKYRGRGIGTHSLNSR